jgi:hypothetical protein
MARSSLSMLTAVSKLVTKTSASAATAAWRSRRLPVAAATVYRSPLKRWKSRGHSATMLLGANTSAKSASSRATSTSKAKIKVTVFPAPCSSNTHRPGPPGTVMAATLTSWCGSSAARSVTSARSRAATVEPPARIRATSSWSLT